MTSTESGEPPVSVQAGSLNALRPEVRRALPWVVLLRLVCNTGIRMTYSFLPAFARGAAVSERTMSWVLSVRDLTALSAPMAGRAADRVGTGRVMAFAGVGAAGGLALSATGSTGLIVGLVVVGLCVVAYNVAIQVWVGHAVAYERRARVSGLVELSWGGAALIGVPTMGLLIDSFGWRAAPAFLAALALPLSLFLSRLDSSISASDPGEAAKPTMTRAAIGGLAVNTVLAISAQFLFLSHGIWLEDTYGLSTAQIGGVVFAAAVMEVVATLGAARLTDIVGKRRAILAGTVLMAVCLLALGMAPDAPLVVAVVLLSLVFLGFEFAIVSAIPLIAELDPNARAAMVSRATALSTVFRAIVSLFAVALYDGVGFGPLMMIAGGFAVLAIVLAALVMEEPVIEGSTLD